jgi:hypothetical protein
MTLVANDEGEAGAMGGRQAFCCRLLTEQWAEGAEVLGGLVPTLSFR